MCTQVKIRIVLHEVAIFIFLFAGFPYQFAFYTYLLYRDIVWLQNDDQLEKKAPLNYYSVAIRTGNCFIF